MTQPDPKPAKDFAETAVGAVVLLSLQFFSFPILVGGLALIGVWKIVSSLRTAPR